MKRIWLVAPILVGLCFPSASSAAAPACSFSLGFRTLHDALPGKVGACLDGEAYNAKGDSNQHTAGGLLAWRKADNWTAFTDGYMTWVNGPSGIQVRLNTERFPWEASDSTTSSSVSISSSNGCTAVAHSGDVSAVGLNSSTTVSVSDGSTTVVNEHSSSSSTPGVATSGC